MCSLCYSGLRAWGRYAQRHSALKVEGTPRDPMNKEPRRPTLHWLTFSTNSNNGHYSGYSNKLVIIAIIVMVEVIVIILTMNIIITLLPGARP